MNGDTPELKLSGEGDGPIDSAAESATNPVQEVLGTEAKILLKSIRIPSDGPIPDDLQQQIRDVVSDHIQKHKITLRAVGQQVGVAESTISEVLRGVYKRADPSAALRRLNTWIDDDERRRQRVRPVGFVDTGMVESVRAAIAYIKSNANTGESTRAVVTRDSQRIALCYGPAGLGKTMIAKAVVAEDTTAIGVRIKEQSGTGVGVARLIAAELGWRGRSGGIPVTDYVVDRLRGSGRLIVIDEAHRLRFSGYEFLRDLSDISGVPVLMMATEEVAEKVVSVRTNTRNKLYDQFGSRVGFMVNLIKGVDGQGGTRRPVFTLEEIRAIFKHDGLRITTDAVEYLRDCACTSGSGMLRAAAGLFDKAVRSALRGGREITESMLRKIASVTLFAPGESPAEGMARIERTREFNRAVDPAMRVAIA